MTEEDLIADARTLSRWQRHKFMMLIGGTITISLILVVIALILYNTSGAAQLDLSRPGYQSVRDKADRSEDDTNFSSTGPLDKDSLTKFRILYNSKMKEVNAVDAFGGDIMSDKALSLDELNPEE
jgi:hypothetical protein